MATLNPPPLLAHLSVLLSTVTQIVRDLTYTMASKLSSHDMQKSAVVPQDTVASEFGSPSLLGSSYAEYVPHFT